MLPAVAALALAAVVARHTLFYAHLLVAAALLACVAVRVRAAAAERKPAPPASAQPQQPTPRPPAFVRSWNDYLVRRARESRDDPGAADVLARVAPGAPAIAARVRELLALVARDFVRSWFSEISSEPAWPAAVDDRLRRATLTIAARLRGLDLGPFVFSRVLPLLTFHLAEYRAAERSLRGLYLQRTISNLDEYNYELVKYYNFGRIHPALTLNSAPTIALEYNYLRPLVEGLLRVLLDSADVDAASVRMLLREIVVVRVLQPVVDMFSDPDFWNVTIIGLTDRAIVDYNLVEKVKRALSNEEKSHTDASALYLDDVPSMVPTYGEFVRTIETCSNLLEARQLLSKVKVEIQRKKQAISKSFDERNELF